MTLTPSSSAPARARRIRLLTVALAGVVLAVGVYTAVGVLTQPRRTTPVYDPPVLAGQPLWGLCTGGFYARRGETIVLTSTGHCTTEGTVAYDADGTTVRGVFGPAARDATCPYPGHVCAASDLNYLVVATDRIPWGHLNVVDLGTAGYRVIAPGTRPLACADVAIGDPVEIDGRGVYRSGTVAEKGENLNDGDGAYFPCMIAARIPVAIGDSGGAVLVRGIPAGVTSRSFAGNLGFTPLAEGLAELGLELCTTPDCGLTATRRGVDPTVGGRGETPALTMRAGRPRPTTTPNSRSPGRLRHHRRSLLGPRSGSLRPPPPVASAPCRRPQGPRPPARSGPDFGSCHRGGRPAVPRCAHRHRPRRPTQQEWSAMDVVDLARIQFAVTVAFHFIFPSITIGLALLIAITETARWRTDRELYDRMARFWTRLFAVTFVVGVATGIVMEFQFGTNWARYAKFVGDIFGAPLAAEGVFAFFLESVFLGILLWGRDRVGSGFRTFAAWMVAVGSTLSAFWIIVANSWMQTPAGLRGRRRQGRPDRLLGRRLQSVHAAALLPHPLVVMGRWAGSS